MQPSTSLSADAPTAWLVYDGECPFCSAYIRFLRFRKSAGAVELIDARSGGPVVDEIVAAGLDLDEGMVLKMGGRFYHGDDCIHALALMSGGSTVFNRLNAWVFKSPARARWLYPMLRVGRNTALRLFGRRTLSHVNGNAPASPQ
jgi:predicted DCC family thiol-disulfide oxidoreductase YuxK